MNAMNPVNEMNETLETSLHAELRQHKTPDVGLLVEDHAARLAGAVARTRFDANQNWRITSLRCLQHSRELEAMSWENTIVVIGGRN